MSLSAEESGTLLWLDDKQDEMTALITELCDINSGTHNLDGLAKVRDRLADCFAQLGGEVTIVQSEPWESVDDDGNAEVKTSGDILHVHKWPDAKQKVMLCIHMDTVFGPEHSFQKCRTADDGTIVGPGVIDAKGGIVLMLYALKALEQGPLAGKVGWEVIINADEEIGSPGSDKFMRERAPHCDAGILFEPSLPDGTLVSWRKGSGNFAFVVQGKSAHTGRDFAAGRNALAALSRMMVEVDSWNDGSDVTWNVGRMRGGSALNMVPNMAVGRVNIRVKTLAEKDEAIGRMEKLVAQHGEQDGITVNLHGDFKSPPKPMNAEIESMQKRIESCGERIGIEIKWRGTGGACDGNRFADAGLPNIDTLGPSGDFIHSDREFLIPASLVPRAKLAALVLTSFANE